MNRNAIRHWRRPPDSARTSRTSKTTTKKLQKCGRDQSNQFFKPDPRNLGCLGFCHSAIRTFSETQFVTGGGLPTRQGPVEPVKTQQKGSKSVAGTSRTSFLSLIQGVWAVWDSATFWDYAILRIGYSQKRRLSLEEASRLGRDQSNH